ncbi:hypothetical protein VdG1_01622 [Verticillium dahliae VDG1]|nr:hypothetical protein VdG1_01622 [Verticillium dahliae VDG1]
MDKATRISTIAKPATSYEAQHKARVVSLDIPPPVPPKDPPRPATSSTTRSGPAKRPVANATTKLKGATMSSRPTTSSTRPGTTSTLAGTMSSIQGAGSKIKAGLRPLKLAALTSHPTRPMPTISRPQTASNTTIASPVRPTTSSTRRFSRSTTMTGRTIKYGSGRYATTELSPQPSDDEDDPLNWPLWKKDLNLFALLVTVCLVSAMKTAFIPVAAKLAIQFQVSHTAIASLTAVPFIFSSITGLASVTASKIWGKRPVYLLSMVFLFIGALWNMRSTTFGTTLGARIFQGIGWGAFDTLVLSSIHDTYFEHQRNPRLAAYDILQAATAWGPPLLSGVAMRNAARFEIHFEILNTFFIVAIPLLAFAAPETAYDRWQYLRTMKPISSFRGFDFTLLNLVAALGVGTVLAAIGILSFGLEIHGSRNISFKLLSVLAGFLAVGVYVLNALARPVIYRSAQYTSSNLHVCLRNVADMDAGLVCWKNMFAAFFILGVASAVEARRSAGLRSSVIGIGVSQIFVALFVGTVWWFMDERLRRLDGRVMGLVDMGMLKRAGSFFDED